MSYVQLHHPENCATVLMKKTDVDISRKFWAWYRYWIIFKPRYNPMSFVKKFWRAFSHNSIVQVGVFLEQKCRACRYPADSWCSTSPKNISVAGRFYQVHLVSQNEFRTLELKWLLLKEFQIFKVKSEYFEHCGASLNERMVSFIQYKTPVGFANFLLVKFRHFPLFV